MQRFANPLRFQRIADAVLPWAGGAAVVLGVLGLYLALIDAPADYQQGEAYRIMFVHVPAAWMAMFCYLCVAVGSAVGLIWRHPLAEVAARAAAPIGAVFTAVALVTGSIWGKPMWGTWWVWDARLTSVLILFFLYLGYIALHDAFEDPARGARAASILALVGVGQPADHQVLGRLVEHAAPARQHHAHGRPASGAGDALAAADHGGGVSTLFRHRAHPAHARPADRAADPEFAASVARAAGA